MALLRPRRDRKPSRLPAYRTLRCPLNGHQISWCMRLCEPIEGQGICGRLAPHAMISRTQVAIAAYKERQRISVTS